MFSVAKPTTPKNSVCCLSENTAGKNTTTLNNPEKDNP
jgi:hypothetical protein